MEALNGVPQNRERCFMISIRDYDGEFTFPNKEELCIKLGDLLEYDVDEKYYLSDKLITCFLDMTNRNGLIRGLRFRPKGKNEDYAWTITTRAGSRATDNYIIEPIPAAIRGRLNASGEYEQKLEPRTDGNTNTITTVQKDNVVIIAEDTKRGYSLAKVGDGIYTNRIAYKRGVVQKDKIPTLKTSVTDIAVVVEDPKELISIRRLTPRECFRLMGWSDANIDRAFASDISDTQLYKMAGNSIVVNCLAKIFEKLKNTIKEIDKDEEVKNAYDKACKEKAYKTGKATKMRAYLEAMKQANTYLDEWSNEMWVLMVSRAIVNRDGSIKFEFVNGQEVTI